MELIYHKQIFISLSFEKIICKAFLDCYLLFTNNQEQEV
jgi:hypothetical protein